MTRLSRRTLIGAAIAGAAFARPVFAAVPELTVYKSPSCGCCGDWVAHVRDAGFSVRVEHVDDLIPIKERFGVPPELDACHTAMIDGFVVEGHVPAREIVRLLDERPDAIGLAVPGMPLGSPGMEQGDAAEPFDVILFAATERRVYARY